MTVGADRVGADVGGTFTDVILDDGAGGVLYEKVLSTPPFYDRAVVDATRRLLARAADGRAARVLAEVVHGTTVATNAVLERRGARTAIVTTEGFRDVLELRRMRMPHLYDYFWTKPPSLVPRQLRFEVRERMGAEGQVITALDEDDAMAVAARLREAEVESVAVCLLHAHRYPEHERRLGEILRRELPETPISLSSEILREEQEYERTATTAVNAYVTPLMSGYLRDILRGIESIGSEAPLMMMQSSGGVMTADDAAQRPVYALESGPAAGVVAALGLAQSLGYDNVIAFDMGGTTAKASLIEGGRVSRSQEYEVGASLSAGSRLLRGSGELIRIPTIDIAEVGAGGGSIAWLDPAGALQVGPRSAGANPGPACYGLGGTDPTVTDANVLLGYMPTGPLASGDLSVSSDQAARAFDDVAHALGLSELETARGVHELANARMMRALRAVSTEKGRDPADFVLFAYGGSGPVHAAALAAELGVRTAVVPPLAGLFSSAGLLFARPEFHDVRFCRVDARDPDLETLRELDEEMRMALERRIAEPGSFEWLRWADIRYKGQNWSVTVEFEGEIVPSSIEALMDRFEDEHERLYGTRLEPGAPLEIRAMRTAILGPSRKALAAIDPSAGATVVGATSRLADFGGREGPTETPVRTRASIGSEPCPGPLLIDEYDTTVVVPPGWTARLHEQGALVLDQVSVSVPVRPAERGRDGVTDQIVANNLATVADEMATTIFRTAHSSVVRDAMDFSAALCGPTGETVAQAVTIPLQLGSIPDAMRTLLHHFGDSLNPGDVYIVNDPFDGASHTPDIFIAKPAFLGETLIGFAVTVAHHGDIGGRVPGTIACDSTEVFQEGLRIPWVRLYECGRRSDTVFELIRANARMPREIVGDLNAQVSACVIGERGLQALAERYGASALSGLMAGLIDHTETLLRREISAWPNGTAAFTDYLDSDGIEVMDVPITVHLRIEDDEIVADFSESAPMVRGALNCTQSFVEASVYHTIMAACAAEIPNTGGATRPVRVVTKPGTITHVILPGASSQRGITGYRISDVMNGALAQLIPDRVPAAGEGGSTLAFFAGRVESEPFLYSELVVGTWGGRPIADGNDGLANPCASIANISIEVAETNWPIFIERYGLVCDTGGAGKFRGGLALERVWRARVPDTLLQVRSDRQIHRPYGLNGGHPGGRSDNLMLRPDGQIEQFPPMFGAVLQPGDVYHHRTAGGGGWGDPLEREPAAVAYDVLEEKVGPQAARELYGVVLAPDGSVDLLATEEARLLLRAGRSEADVDCAGSSTSERPKAGSSP